MGPGAVVAEVTGSARNPPAEVTGSARTPGETTGSVRTAAQEEPTGAAQLRGAARHGVANLAGVAVAAAAAFALNIVVTRGWSVLDAGLFFAGTSAFMIAYAAARLGTGVGSVYFVSRARALGQPERIRPAVLAGAVPVALVGTGLGIAGWVLAPALAGVLFRDPTPDAVPMLRSLALFLPVAALGEMALAACRGFGRMGPLLLVDRLGRHGLQLVAVALAAVLGASVATGLPLAWALPYLPATVIALGWLALLVRRAERAAAGARPRPVRLAWEYWRYTGPRALGSLAQMTVQRLDIVLLAALRGSAEAAVYTAATRFLTLGQLSAQALATAVQHRIAGQMARGDRAAVGRLYQATTGWLVLLAWPAYLLFAVFAEAVLALFGPGYGSGRTVTVVLALTMLLATGCGMVDSVLNMAGKTSWTFYNALAAVAVNVVGNLLLIPPYGMVGAAAAWSAAIAVGNLVPLAQLYGSMRLHPFGRGTLLAAALATVCFGLPPLLARLVYGANLPVLAAVAAAGALAYAAGAWRWRSVLQLDALRAAVRRPRGDRSGGLHDVPNAAGEGA